MKFRVGPAFRLALLLSATVAAACQPVDSGTLEGAPEAPEAVADGGYLEAVPRLGLDREMEVGGFFPDLGPIRWFGVASDGTMALSQARDFLIRLVDSAGGPLGSVGGSGRAAAGGSPELLDQGGAGWIGDTLWVSDVSLGRVALYSRDRKLVRTLPPLVGARAREGEESRFPTFLSVSPLALYPGDTLMVAADLAFGRPPTDPFAQGIHLFRVSADGVIQSHVLDLPEGGGRPRPNFGDRNPVPRESSAAGGPLSSTSIHYVAPVGDRFSLITAGPDGEESPTWWIRVVDALGEVRVNRRFPFRGAPILTEVVVGSDHRIWVRLEDVAEADGASGAPFWLVLSPEGDPVARVPLPGDVRLLAADETRVLAEDSDALGAPTLVRYRIREGG